MTRNKQHYQLSYKTLNTWDAALFQSQNKAALFGLNPSVPLLCEMYFIIFNR